MARAFFIVTPEFAFIRHGAQLRGSSGNGQW